MKLNKSTLSIQIYQILREDILSHKISLGEKLTLKNLQERFQVSSTPIRDALTRLTEEGLVEYYSNIGVNVILLAQKDLNELYQFMGDLDGLSILYASAQPDQTELLRELEEVLAVTEQAEQMDPDNVEETARWIRASDRFHLAFYDHCNNSRLVTAAQRLRSQLTIFSNSYEKESQPQKEIHREHANIFKAYKSEDYPQAADLMKQHLQHSLQYIQLENK